MKCLTLNTHSWMEEAPLEKLENVAQFILSQDFDWIALQEVNQSLEAEDVIPDDFYCASKQENLAIKVDNFVLMLAERLQELGRDYYWSWTCSHIGYERFHEGVALLSKTPFIASSLLVSPMDEKKDYHTRKQIQAIGTLADGQVYRVLSCHYSWWTGEEDTGFQYEWQQTLAGFKEEIPTLLMGDFNAPSYLEKESFTLMQKHFTDSYAIAQERKGEMTVGKIIDGWHDKEAHEAMRLDYILVPETSEVALSAVVLDGINGPIVSDHFGLMIDLKI
ncbi:endonuclease/exonuclease/phosphatase family protein [Vagococcus sp.]|uniref:endonuclease/exonuclease/phosphatase family protein n=1 Tax=Vagococcus sp. TaxID=1933889 RepID=UPI003F978A07